MENNLHHNYSEKKLKKLKKRFAYVEKYDYFLAGCWAFIGIAQAGTQWLLGRSFLLSGIMLATFGAIAFGIFDRKHTFCRYKLLTQEENDKILSRHARYKKISLLFGILGLVDIVIWFSIGLLLHGRYALRVMFDEPIWCFFGLLLWVPWIICRNRIQALNFIRLSRDEQDESPREGHKFIRLGIGLIGLIAFYFMGVFLSNQLVMIEQQWKWVVTYFIIMIVIPTYALLFMIWLWAWNTTQMCSRRIWSWCGRLIIVSGFLLYGFLYLRVMNHEAGETSCTVAMSLIPDESHPYIGFWKQDCRESFGLAIAEAGEHKYSVFFCGPGGCAKPGMNGPSTSLVDDPKYRILNKNVIEIEDYEGFSRYYRCGY